MVEIGMPAMTMDFQISADVPLEKLPGGKEVMLLFLKNPDFTLTLIGVTDDKSVDQ